MLYIEAEEDMAEGVIVSGAFNHSPRDCFD